MGCLAEPNLGIWFMDGDVSLVLVICFFEAGCDILVRGTLVVGNFPFVRGILMELWSRFMFDVGASGGLENRSFLALGIEDFPHCFMAGKQKARPSLIRYPRQKVSES